MTFKTKTIIVALGACIAAPAAAHDLSIPIVVGQAFMARAAGSSYVRDNAIGFMFEQSKTPVNGTEITDPSANQPGLARQIAIVTTGINLGAMLWTIGKMGLKKLAGIATEAEAKLFDQAYDSGMDIFVAIEAARDTYNAVQAIISESNARQITAPGQSMTAMIPAYAYTFVPNAIASYYAFALGVKAGETLSSPLAKAHIPAPITFAITMWTIGISLSMTALAAIQALGEQIGLTNDCKACSAIGLDAQQLSYVATGMTMNLINLWRANKLYSKKAA